MANNIDIRVRAKDDTAAGLRKTDKAVKKFSKSFNQRFGGMIRIAKRVGAAIVGIGVAFGALSVYLVKAASDAQETASKFNTVFSSITEAANKTAKSLAKEFGIASSTAKTLLGDTGDLLVGFGFTEDAALDLANEVNRLAIDLASYTNFSGGAAGASKALTKLLLGETESAKSLGIVVRQGSKEYKDSVAAKMRDQGVTLLQAKALTALEMAAQQSGKAVGDYNRTQDDVANSSRRLMESWKELAEAGGDVITETAGVADILNKTTAAVEELTKATEDMVDSGKAEAWGEEANKALDSVKGNVGTLSKAWGVLTGVIDKGSQAFEAANKATGGAGRHVIRTLGGSKGRAAVDAFDVATKIRGVNERAEVLKQRREEGTILSRLKDRYSDLTKSAKEFVIANAPEKEEPKRVPRSKYDPDNFLQKIGKELKTIGEHTIENVKELAEERKRMDAEQGANVKKLVAAQDQMADAAAEARAREFDKQAEAGEKNLVNLQERIEGIAKNKDERKAQEQAQDKAAQDQRREDDLLERQGRRGTTISKDAKAFLKQRELQRNIIDEQKKIEQARKNAADIREQRADMQRERTMWAAEDTVKELQANLKAG